MFRYHLKMIVHGEIATVLEIQWRTHVFTAHIADSHVLRVGAAVEGHAVARRSGETGVATTGTAAITVTERHNGDVLNPCAVSPI